MSKNKMIEDKTAAKLMLVTWGSGITVGFVIGFIVGVNL